MRRFHFRWLAICVFWSSLAVAASAQTVSIHALESSENGEAIEAFVSGCMDAFFEGGYIATNSPSALSGEPGILPEPRDLEDARGGFVDYLLYLIVTWRKADTAGERSLPGSVEFRLVRIADGILLSEGRLEETAFRGGTEAAFGGYLGSLGAAVARNAISTIKQSRIVDLGGKE